VDARKQRLRDLGRALPKPDTLIAGPAQRLDYLGERLPDALRAAASRKALQLADVGLRPGLLRRGLASDAQRFAALAARLGPALERRVSVARDDLARRKLPLPDVARAAERFDAIAQRLSDRATRDQETRVARLDALDRLRETLGYKETLRRGYAVVRGDGDVVTTVAAARGAKALEVEFADGKLALSGGRPKGKADKPDDQGSLF
jgi:exodeoxyribonuclease VII large subunit